MCTEELIVHLTFAEWIVPVDGLVPCVSFKSGSISGQFGLPEGSNFIPATWDRYEEADEKC